MPSTNQNNKLIYKLRYKPKYSKILKYVTQDAINRVLAFFKLKTYHPPKSTNSQLQIHRPEEVWKYFTMLILIFTIIL